MNSRSMVSNGRFYDVHEERMEKNKNALSSSYIIDDIDDFNIWKPLR